MRNGDLAVALGGSHAAAAASMVGGGGNSDRPSAASNGSSSSGETSLLDWINSKGGGGSLEQVPISLLKGFGSGPYGEG